MRIQFFLLPAFGFFSSVSPAFDLAHSPAGAQPVGTMLTWTAAAPGDDPSAYQYRFRVRRAGEEFRMLRDFGPLSSFDWTAADREGDFEMEATVRDRSTGETAIAVEPFRMESHIAGAGPVVSPTAHPLVWLYSAAGCPEGSRMRVELRSPEDDLQRTPSKPCRADASMNFYLGGMRSATEYRVRQVVETGAEQQPGPELTLVTGDAEVAFDGGSLNPATAPPAGFLLYSLLNLGPVAVDFTGQVVWYYNAAYLSKFTRPVPGGSFVGIVKERPDHEEQIVREFDLVGMTLRETNAARINEQLEAMGKPSIGGFHHEARALPDGRLLVLAAHERLLTDVQGRGTVDVIGDMILVLDRDLQVSWTWDAFDHLDPHRKAILDEVCVSTPTGSSGGCPILYRSDVANDWLHGNSVQLAPDGNLLYSVRHQDWIVKIDYANGAGTGDILWRLGPGGDFQADSPDRSPWFSHQHDPEFENGSDSTLVLFDNGNTRRQTNPAANSRGQAIELDETRRIARFVLNADLGAYSSALGSARSFPNGNYQFDLGYLPDLTALSSEVNARGESVYGFRRDAPAYRVFRMRTMYAQF